jgi:hypothetical protein
VTQVGEEALGVNVRLEVRVLVHLAAREAADLEKARRKN